MRPCLECAQVGVKKIEYTHSTRRNMVSKIVFLKYINQILVKNLQQN